MGVEISPFFYKAFGGRNFGGRKRAIFILRLVVRAQSGLGKKKILVVFSSGLSPGPVRAGKKKIPVYFSL